MNEDIYVDTRLLRDHVFDIRRETAITQELRDRIEVLRRLGDGSNDPQYRSIQNRVDLLISYFQKMAETLENAADQADAISRIYNELLQDESDIVRKTFPNVTA